MNIAMKIARETELCVFIKMCVTACVCVCACKSLYFAYECVNGSVSKWVKVSVLFARACANVWEAKVQQKISFYPSFNLTQP